MPIFAEIGHTLVTTILDKFCSDVGVIPADQHTNCSVDSVVKVEILRWGNCTCTLGPLSVHVGRLLTVVPPRDH